MKLGLWFLIVASIFTIVMEGQVQSARPVPWTHGLKLTGLSPGHKHARHNLLWVVYNLQTITLYTLVKSSIKINHFSTYIDFNCW